MEVENLCKKHVMDQLNSSIQQQTCGVFVLFLWLLNQHRHLMLASLQAFLHQGEVHLCNPESF